MAHPHSSSAHPHKTRSPARTALYVLGALGSLGATIGVGIWLWKQKAPPAAPVPVQPSAPPPRPPVQQPPVQPVPAPAPAAPPATPSPSGGLVQVLAGVAQELLKPKDTPLATTAAPPPPSLYPDGTLIEAVTVGSPNGPVYQLKTIGGVQQACWIPDPDTAASVTSNVDWRSLVRQVTPAQLAQIPQGPVIPSVTGTTPPAPPYPSAGAA